MTSSGAGPWIAYRKPRRSARLRLFCFPYAGGGALTYRPWVPAMPPEIEVCPVQLPGREQRLREPRFRRVAPLVEAAAEGLEPLLDLPFAFFGYSMGALIAYELIHRLRPARSPVALLAAARRAPQLPPKDEPTYDLPDPEFRAKLREMNGTPQEVLDNRELMELMEPLLRADFELNDTYEPPERPPLELPVTAFGGIGDAEVPRETLAAWGELTTGPFRLRMFPGGHFYLHRQTAPLVAAVSEALLRRA